MSFGARSHKQRPPSELGWQRCRVCLERFPAGPPLPPHYRDTTPADGDEAGMFVPCEGGPGKPD